MIKFGSELRPEHYSDHAELTQELRNAMAALKWEIWEKEGIQSRDSLPENIREQFHSEFERRIHPWDTLETVERTRFHTPADIAQKEVESHLDRLIPRRENAFLFRKKGCELRETADAKEKRK